MSSGVAAGPVESEKKRSIAGELEQTRARTLALAAAVTEDAARRQVHVGYSPFDWHLGHIALIEAQWVLKNAAGQPSPDPDLDFIFSNVPENPKAGRVHLPDRPRILRYLQSVRMRTLEFLAQCPFDSPDPLLRDGYCFGFAFAHEWQHQETLVEMLHLMDGVREIEPLSPAADPGQPPGSFDASAEVFVPAGEFTRGTDDVHAYDNERPANAVRTAAFAIDVLPVTAAQFQRFIDDGGYRRRALWDDEGWDWLRACRIDSPEYVGRGPFGRRAAHPGEPAASVSWYEASAYALWAGKRLPTEAEWEKAASWDPSTGAARRYPWGDEEPSEHRADFNVAHWGPRPAGSFPAGRSAWGCLDMAGGVWEWTSSIFDPYDGFTSFPYDGYSKIHFDGTHKVLKGGSWATRGPLLRCSFRNFYRPGYRQGFLGFRCARTVRKD